MTDNARIVELEAMVSERDQRITALEQQVKRLKNEIAILERSGWAEDRCGDDDWET